MSSLASASVSVLQWARLAAVLVAQISPAQWYRVRVYGMPLMFVGIAGNDTFSTFYAVLALLFVRNPILKVLFAGSNLLLVAESLSARGIAEASLAAFMGQLAARWKLAEKQDEMRAETFKQGISFYAASLLGWFWSPPNVELLPNLTYVLPHEELGDSKLQRWHTLDIVRRKSGYHKRPVLIYVHGGAWTMGDKQQRTMPTCWHFAAEENWVVLNINYRLGTKFNLYDMVVDIKRAIRWAKQNSHIHGGDSSFIAISGGSAGAHLALIAALTPNWSDFQPGFESVDTRVRACFAIYPPVGHVHTNQPWKKWFMEHIVQIPDDVYRSRFGRGVEDWADPSCLLARLSLQERKESVPPIFVAHGSYDAVASVRHMRSFVEEARREGGVAIGYLELPRTPHAYDIAYTPKTMYANWAGARALTAVHEGYQESHISS
ncbi:Alpha/Beta hydrolase protein [Chytriomyces sp. MP71]|nr:Alpha/Beta hydrolase protein [Chytriomyces sp. MP71]